MSTLRHGRGAMVGSSPTEPEKVHWIPRVFCIQSLGIQGPSQVRYDWTLQTYITVSLITIPEKERQDP